MIGLISSIYSTTGSAQGISFAIPAETVKRVSSQIIENGSIRRGVIDAVLMELNPQIISYLNLPIHSGLMVSQVIAGGNAEKAGLKGGTEKALYGDSTVYLSGDVIVEINGKQINGYADYFLSLFGSESGETVEITVYRNGRYVVLDTVLVEQGDDTAGWIIR